MYPYFRLARVIVTAMRRRPLSFDESSYVRLLVWPGDIDIYPEMNNGRHLTVMDLGRVDFAIRTGVITVAHKRGWSLVAAGASIRFRRRLSPFRRFVISTRALGHDDRWFYFLHETEQGGRTCSSALVRAGLRSKEGLVPAGTVLEALGNSEWKPALPDWVEKWIEAEGLRPQS